LKVTRGKKNEIYHFRRTKSSQRYLKNLSSKFGKEKTNNFIPDFFFTIETFEKEKLHYKYREKVFFVFFFSIFFSEAVST